MVIYRFRWRSIRQRISGILLRYYSTRGGFAFALAFLVLLIVALAILVFGCPSRRPDVAIICSVVDCERDLPITRRLPERKFVTLAQPKSLSCASRRHGVILVQSRPKARQFRDQIRRTWGDSHLLAELDFHMLFLLGSDPEENEKISIESQLFDDILQNDFVDSYVNVTLKLLSTLQWLEKQCSQDNFWIIKTDDDFIVNVFVLRNLVASNKLDNRVIYCSILLGELCPIRWPFSKYLTTWSEWPERLYPPNCYGGGYMLRSDVARALLRTSHKTFNRHEDTLLTGLLVDVYNRELPVAGVGKLRHEALSDRQQFDECVDAECILERRIIFTHGDQSLDSMQRVWRPIRRHHRRE